MVLSLVLLATRSVRAQPDDLGSLAERIERAATDVRNGQLTRAIAELVPIVAARPELAEARLLLAVAYLRNDDLAHARALFLTLRDDPSRAIAETARTCLALIEARLGNEDESRSYLLKIDRASPLGTATRPLLERLQPARLRFFFLLQPGFDSNVGRIANLSQAPSLATSADGYVLMATSIGVRPVRKLAWQIETALTYRVHFSQRAYDFVAHQLASRYYFERGRHQAWAHVALLTQVLGGRLLSVGTSTTMRYRVGLARHVGLAFDYAGRYTRFDDPTYRFLSGHDHLGTIETWVGTLPTWEIAAGYRPGGQIAEDAAFSYHSHAAYVRGQWRRRFFEASGAIRGGASYYRQGRFDRFVGGELNLGFDLRREVAIVVDASLWRNQSNVPDFSYWRGVIGVGVVASYVGL